MGLPISVNGQGGSEKLIPKVPKTALINTMVLGTWYQAINLTGKGVIKKIGITSYDGNSANLKVRVTIDGVVYLIDTNLSAFMTSLNAYVIYCHFYDYGFKDIPFDSSVLIEISPSAAAINNKENYIQLEYVGRT